MEFKQVNYQWFSKGLSVLALTLILAPVPSTAANLFDEPSLARTTTSPFTPPTEDVFVTNKGPGLDTGCTFNTDLNHPLVIEIEIDRAVGEVDANGFLVDPAAVVAAGIVPATVELLMPAFDVDVNGGPPPEQDLVIFNGTNLGLLTGDNNIWKLNAFNLDIGQIKFPAPPATPGGAVTPAINTIQINIDILSVGNWCTAIDWTALNIPITTNYALTITSVNGHLVEEIADKIIYKQSFDDECNLTTDIGPIDEYPFVGTRSKDVTLKTEIERCPAGGDDPEVELEWEISGPIPLQTSGTTTWTGFEHDAKVRMLDRVASATALLKYKIDGDPVEVERKVFTTYSTPRATADCVASPCTPKRKWYELGVDWAGGVTGAMTEPETITKVRQGMYGNPLGWRYFDHTRVIAHWPALVDGGRDNTNCVGFSHVLQNISAVLGANAGAEDQHKPGHLFIPNAKPSIDGAFFLLGPQGGANLDRHMFSMHSLVTKGSGPFHDATFDGEYANKLDFVEWNWKTPRSQIFQGGFRWTETNEGALVRLTATALTPPYDMRWATKQWRYLPPPEPALFGIIGEFNNVADNMRPGPGNALGGGSNIAFSAPAVFALEDDNSNGYADGLLATIPVEILTGGNYVVEVSLVKNGVILATRPRWDSMFGTLETDVAGLPGVYQTSFQFSGEEIFRAGENGPYELLVSAYSETALEAQTSFNTPPYTVDQFGELPAGISAVVDSGFDTDNDGRFDTLRADVEVQVREPGEYLLSGSLWKDQDTIVDAVPLVPQTLAIGTSTITLNYDALAIQQFGADGPYTLHLVLTKTDTLEQVENTFDTSAYLLNEFTLTLIRPDGNFQDMGVDTNNNGLFDLLRVVVGADVTAGNYLISAALTNGTDTTVIFSEEQTLNGGNQTIVIDFDGRLIRAEEFDGPYQIEVTLQEPATAMEIERLTLAQFTAPYSHLDFEPMDDVTPQDLELTGNSSDNGIDNNNNNLFDVLQVSIEINVQIASTYQWSARLEDASGTEIAFDSRSGFLAQGTNTFALFYDGEAIGMNGVNGPYEVKGLLIFSSSGPNLVATEVATTNAYLASQFEGFQGTVPGDLNGDGAINAGDAALLIAAFGSCVGDAGFLVDADYDADGCITLQDYRSWYVLFVAAGN